MVDYDKMLLSAAESGSLDDIKKALENGADVNTKETDFKQTALHKASSAGHVEIVEYLLKNGADPLLLDGVDMTPLHLAARDGRTRTVRFLLDNMKEVPERILNDVIHVAHMSVYGNPDIQQMLEDYRVKSVKPSTSGSQEVDKELLDAAHDGDLEAAKKALADGGNVEIVDGRGMKPIHWAALRGHKEIVDALLEKGADVNGRNSAEWTPLMHASLEGHLDIAKLLIEHGAEVNAKTYVSGTALMFASGKGHESIVRLLLSAGADPRIQIEGTDDEDGMTAIDYAFRAGEIGITNLLLDARDKLDGDV